MHNYYLYQHRRTDTGKVFYVGAGKKRSGRTSYKGIHERAFAKSKRHDSWKDVILQTDYTVEILVYGTKEFIYSKEKEYVKMYGKTCDGGTLVNIENGGNGGSNLSERMKSIPVKVDQLSLSGDLIKTWDFLREIEEQLGFLKTNIVKCCRKKQKTAYGFVWRYSENRDFDSVEATSSRVSPEKRKMGVVVTDSLTGQVFEFKSATQAAKGLNLHRTSVSRYMNGKAKHKRLTFKWKEWKSL